MLELLTASSYWVLAFLWIIILGHYLLVLRTARLLDRAIAILLAILAIDAFRTLFESLYFGFYFNAEYGFISPRIGEVLGQPELLILPKGINVAAALLILFLLLRSWLPRLLKDRRDSLDALRRAASVFSNAREGIVIVAPDGRLVEANEAFQELSGYTRDQLLDSRFDLHHSGRHTREFYQQMWRGLSAAGEWSGVIWNRSRSGRIYACNLRINALRDEASALLGYVGFYTDLSAYLAQQEKLERIAQFDALTGLPNRALLADRISQGMLQCRRRGCLMAVMFLDIDHFKAFNDEVGARAGDAALTAVARQILAALRDIDTLARFGGDEFVVVVPDLADEAEVFAVADRITAAMATPIILQGGEYCLSASIGFTIYPFDDGDSDQLVRHASHAMFEAKQDSDRSCRQFDAQRDREREARNLALADIRRGMAGGEFVLYYQPIVSLDDGHVAGFETLLRWRHPSSGLMLPADFLPATYGHPIAVEVGEWVIRAALTQLDVWREQLPSAAVSVNLDAHHIQQPDFCDRLLALLSEHGSTVAQGLEFEVLESSSMENIAAVAEVMGRCRGLGVTFAIDDFGTGYSSLTYLRRLPAARIKVDQSFVCDMLEDPEDAAMVKNVIDMAHSLDRAVIAEGVETVQHLDALRALGCDLAQGFGIARPMPAEDVPAWCERWQAAGDSPF